MTLKRNFVCISAVVALFVSFTYAEAEKKKAETDTKKALALAPSGVLEIDVLQSFAEDDKSGSAAVGRLEAGVETSIGEKVDAGLFLELGDEDVIGPLETWFTFNPVEILSLTAGQLTMPFGEYATELMTDPLVMCGYEIDSITEISGAETIFPGCIVCVEIAGFSGAAGVYNSSYSEHFEACAVKMGYSFKEMVSAGIASRFDTGKKIDLDVNLTISPWPFLALLGEVYTGLNDEKSDNRLLGIHSELDIMPLEPLVIAVRFGRLVDNQKEGAGGIQLGGCVKYSVSDHITFGIEANGNATISGGETGSWDDLAFRIGCSIE
jgi:hypothetical protein